MIPSEKETPEILQEEEILPPWNRGEEDDALPKARKANLPIETQKFHLGSATLGWCIFLMMVCIVLSIWNPDNELIQSGFEAFKLIVMTILGYMFGSNSAKTD